jgi:hypothetical protein
LIYIDAQRFGAHHIISAVGLGEKRLEQLARFLERDYESAAPPSLYKCLATANLIESPQSGVVRRTARRTANGKYWRDRGMVERWVASAWLLTENRFRKISGHRDLWALATIPGRKTETEIS